MTILALHVLLFALVALFHAELLAISFDETMRTEAQAPMSDIGRPCARLCRKIPTDLAVCYNGSILHMASHSPTSWPSR